MLSLLLAARDPETGEAMSDRQVRDEVMTFVLAGHETTALTLTWALYLLARHPEIDARVRAEIHAALGDRSPTPDDLPRLPYTRAVLDETLRLYPPLWAFGREPISDDRIGGYRIRAGSSVAVVPWITHRLPDVWPDPERFDPERFTGLGARARPRYAYLPFGGGPRQCIGSEFALMEAHLVLPAIVRAYRVELVDDRPVEPYPTVTLRPRTAITARLRPAA
jgi:cytochrome P450